MSNMLVNKDSMLLFFMCVNGSCFDNLCFMLANDVTDEEKRDMLIKVSKNNRDNHSAHLIHILDVRPASEIEDASLPAALTLSKAVEDDGDVVKPEFDAETSAMSQGVQRDNNKGRGRNKIMWGVLACVAIALLALCGILFSKSPEKKDVAQPPAKAVRGSKPPTASRPASYRNKSSVPPVTTPAGQGAAGAHASGGQAAPQQPPTSNSSASASASATTGSSSQSQTATTGTISNTDIQNAIESKKPEKSENVSSSAESRVQTDANKK